MNSAYSRGVIPPEAGFAVACFAGVLCFADVAGPLAGVVPTRAVPTDFFTIVLRYPPLGVRTNPSFFIVGLAAPAPGLFFIPGRMTMGVLGLVAGLLSSFVRTLGTDRTGLLNIAASFRLNAMNSAYSRGVIPGSFALAGLLGDFVTGLVPGDFVRGLVPGDFVLSILGPVPGDFVIGFVPVPGDFVRDLVVPGDLVPVPLGTRPLGLDLTPGRPRIALGVPPVFTPGDIDGRAPGDTDGRPVEAGRFTGREAPVGNARPVDWERPAEFGFGLPVDGDRAGDFCVGDLVAFVPGDLLLGFVPGDLLLGFVPRDLGFVPGVPGFVPEGRTPGDFERFIPGDLVRFTTLVPGDVFFTVIFLGSCVSLSWCAFWF